MRLNRNNAQLTSAFIDLLEAVQHVLSASEDGGGLDDIDWEMLRAASAKAKSTLKAKQTPINRV